MGTNKNSRRRTAASRAKPPQTPYAPTPHLPFRNAGLSGDVRGVPPALLQPPIPAPISPSSQFLIATPGLEFPVTPTKHNYIAIPNRDKKAIFDSRVRAPLLANPQHDNFQFNRDL